MKLFTKPLTSCELCPHCVHIDSPWSGKLLSGPEAAKQMGVYVDPAMEYTSNAALCKESRVMLPVNVVIDKKPWPLKDKRKTIPTFVFPAHCKLNEAGAEAASGPPVPTGAKDVALRAFDAAKTAFVQALG
jgi:hypothetical protein